MTLTLPQLSHLPVREQFRDLSIASAPYQLPVIQTIVRSSESKFKQTLLTLKPGSEVEIEGPGGRFFLPSDDPVVLIAGGIGLTPFLSMMRQLEHDAIKRDIQVICFSRSVQQELLKQELLNLTCCRVTWETGQITQAKLSAYLNSSASWLIAGPPAMTSVTKDYLLQLGTANAKIFTEEFAGYDSTNPNQL